VESADIVIINTCAFILPAREEAIETILEAVSLKKSGTIKRIYVTGCLPQRYRDDLAKEIPEVDGFYFQKDFKEIGRQICLQLNCDTSNGSANRLLQTPNHFAYLKIAEGCDNRCSYCTIPLIKGKYESKTLVKLLREAKHLVDNGVRELILVAQDTTYYGWDKNEKDALPQLIRSLAKIKQLKWIRILYAHPAHLTEKMINLFKDEEKLCRYIDLPVQHISDNVLKAMSRPSTGNEVRKKIEDLRKAVPEMAIRTTVLVGYPGETEADFEQLKNFLAEVKFERLGVFKFIREEGTNAARMKNQIDEGTKEDRHQELMEQQYKISEKINRKFLGRTISVLIDEEDKTDNNFLARSEWDSPQIDNLVHVKGQIQRGQFYPVKIYRAEAYDLWAKKIE
jgi:ribosomal protein S12 methylthiotransferase